jgi:hypothetical protein
MVRWIPVLGLLLATPAWAQVVPMTNNECTSAIVVGTGTNPGAPNGLTGHVFTNVGATASASPICVSGLALDVWFSYTPSASAIFTVSTCTPVSVAPGSLADTVLTVFDGSVCPPTVIVGCDDDSCLSRSSTSVFLTAGALYFIRVAGFSGTVGTFYLSIQPPIVPITNDECTSPIPLSLGSNGPFGNAQATNSPGVAASCSTFQNPGHKDVWFSYTPACSGGFIVNTGCNGFDTILTAYTSCGGPELVCSDDATGCGLSSAITVPGGTAGLTYLIRVAAWSTTNTGTFFVNVAPAAGLTLGMSSPFGAGSIQIGLTGGPPSGTYILAITTYAGIFPNGWLFGLDMPLAELFNQLSAGPPFFGTLGSCGELVIGPFGGLGFLSGITLYGVALAMPPGSITPTAHSAALSHTIP